MSSFETVCVLPRDSLVTDFCILVFILVLRLLSLRITPRLVKNVDRFSHLHCLIDTFVK